MTLRKIFFTATLFLAMLFAGCGGTSTHLEQDEAKKMMKSRSDILIVDVRTQAEYDKKHIPGAVLVPIEDLKKGDFSALPDKSKILLLYCWTGRRAEDATAILIAHGYTRIYEFGGLVDWDGSVEGEEVE